ncbi:MAG: BadF/BadG/BcrA/BcrD ATPase family protein [Candidatus Rokuibacteriota bacterium]
MPTGVVVGVDLGGTQVRVVASGPPGWSRRVQSRGPSLADLPGFLGRLWREWRLSPRGVAALVVAAKGVWTPAERRLEERRLRGLAGRVRVVSDVEAAFLGALGDGPGILLLAGTGSIVLGRNRRGRWARAGGLGPLLGDEGSAFWIGRWWLTSTGRNTARDEERLRQIARAPDAVARIAAVATSVLRRAAQGDRRALPFVIISQEILAALACCVAEDLGLSPPVPLSWAGSLMENQAFRAGVLRSLRRQGLRARAVPPAQPPVEAAHTLAARLARGEKG